MQKDLKYARRHSGTEEVVYKTLSVVLLGSRQLRPMQGILVLAYHDCMPSRGFSIIL
jgi:hypothetical protein